MKTISPRRVFSNEILKRQKRTIGMDLGDRWSFCCVLDEAGKILLEQKVPTTPEAMKQTFAVRRLRERGLRARKYAAFYTRNGQVVRVAYVTLNLAVEVRLLAEQTSPALPSFAE
jgi:hypothetical protein